MGEDRQLPVGRVGQIGDPIGSLYVPSLIGPLQVRFLFDTGATCSVVSCRVFRRIPVEIRPDLEGPDIRLRGIDGAALEMWGACSLEVVLDVYPVAIRVQVADIAEEAVLGTDVLRQFKGHWDWDTGRLVFASYTPPYRVRRTKGPSIAASPIRALRGTVEGYIGQVEKQDEEIQGTEVLQDDGWVELPTLGLAPMELIAGVREDIEEPPREDGPDGTPGHLTDLCELGGSRLSQTLQEQLQGLLCEYRDIFSQGEHDMGKTDTEVHRIPTGDARPVRLQPRRVPLAYQQDVEDQIQQFLDLGIVEDCQSPWAAPLVIVKKKDGSNRVCIDYRELNNVTQKDAHPLPRIKDSLDALRGASVYSSLDLTRAYHQVVVHPEDRDKTAFVTGRGHHLRFVTMPFGLCNAPSTFQRLMERVLQGMLYRFVLVYLDDIVVFSKTPEEHLGHLAQVFRRIQEHGLKLKPKSVPCFRERSFI